MESNKKKFLADISTPQQLLTNTYVKAALIAVYIFFPQIEKALSLFVVPANVEEESLSIQTESDAKVLVGPANSVCDAFHRSC